MKRALKWVGIIVVILIVVVLVLPFLINVNALRPRIESELTNALGRKVTVGNLSLSLWSGSLAADNIAIADDPAFGNAPFVKAEALNVGVNMIPLILSKTLEVRDITLTRPQVALLRTPAGKWNFSTIGNSSSGSTQQQPSNSAPQQSQSGQASKPSPAGNQKAHAQSAPPSGAAPSPESKSASEQSLEQNLSVGKLNIRNGQI